MDRDATVTVTHSGTDESHTKATDVASLIALQISNQACDEMRQKMSEMRQKMSEMQQKANQMRPETSEMWPETSKMWPETSEMRQKISEMQQTISALRCTIRDLKRKRKNTAQFRKAKLKRITDKFKEEKKEAARVQKIMRLELEEKKQKLEEQEEKIDNWKKKVKKHQQKVNYLQKRIKNKNLFIPSNKEPPEYITIFLEKNLQVSKYEKGRESLRDDDKVPEKTKMLIQRADKIINFWRNLYVKEKHRKCNGTTDGSQEEREEEDENKENGKLNSVQSSKKIEPKSEETLETQADGDNFFPEFLQSVSQTEMEQEIPVKVEAVAPDDSETEQDFFVKFEAVAPDLSSTLKNNDASQNEAQTSSKGRSVKRRFTDEQLHDMLDSTSIMEASYNKDFGKTKKCRLCPTPITMRNCNHMAYEHGPEFARQCPLCEEQPLDDATLHLSTVHFGRQTYRCESCSKVFRTPKALSKHQPYHSLKYKFKCETCNVNFFTEASLREHENKGHAKKAKEVETATWICDVCGKVITAAKGALNRRVILHQFQVHHPDKKPFTCKICKKSFSSNYRRTIHEFVHNGMRPWQCQIKGCGKCFKSLGNLQQHKAFHESPKFICQCGSKFFFRYQLNKHKVSCES